MPVAVHISTKQKHEAWTAGHCVHCGQTEAMRIERQYRIVWIMFLPLTFRTEKRSLRCDFCERPAENVVAADEVRLNQWSPQQGLPPLARRLRMERAFDGTNANAETRLRSLLQSVQDATSIGKINAVPGVIIGIVVGFALGLALAAGSLKIGIDLGTTDTVGVFLGFGLIGAVVGAILGALVYVWLGRGRLAVAKIRKAHENYNIDLRKLEELAQRYEPRIAQSARTLHDESLLGFQYSDFRTPQATNDFAENR